MPGGCSRSSPCGEEGGGQVGHTPRAPPPGHPCSPGCLPSVLIGLFFCVCVFIPVLPTATVPEAVSWLPAAKVRPQNSEPSSETPCPYCYRAMAHQVVPDRPYPLRSSKDGPVSSQTPPGWGVHIPSDSQSRAMSS